MNKNEYYAKKYESRTEEIKQVLRKNDQNTVDYRLYNEAARRATKDMQAADQMIKWFAKIVIFCAVFVAPCIVTAYFTTGFVQSVIIGGCLATSGIAIGILGMHYASLALVEDLIIIGNPYAKGTIPTTKNKRLRVKLFEYQAKTELIFSELKKDEAKTLDAIDYNNATWESIGDIDLTTVIKHLSIIVFSFLAVGIICAQILSGNVEAIVCSALLIAGYIATVLYAVEFFPMRSNIRIEIRNENPYITDE